MRLRAVVLFAAVWLAAVGAALGEGRVLTIGELYDGGVVNLAPGDALVVRLSADPASGEAWEVALNDATVVRRVEEPPKEKLGAVETPGAAGLKEFRFRAIATGSSSLGLAYRKPADPSSAPSRLFRVLVIVKEDVPRRALTLGEPDNGSTIFLTQGERFVVRLPSNPTTGYTWSVAGNAAAVLQPAGDPRFEPSPNAKPGTGGYQVFEFRVVAPGASSLALAYRRPSEKDQPPARTWGILLAAAGLAGSPS
jgi:inhibitor of cysteine peptidase